MSKKYKMSRETYNRTLWLIRSYEEIKERYDNLACLSAISSDGMPKGNGTSDSTGRKAIERVQLFEECQAIEQAFLMLPYEYREGVWNNVVHRVRYPDTASERTWARWRRFFIEQVAVNIGYFTE